MATGFDGIGHEDHHIKRRHVERPYRVPIDSLKDARRKLREELGQLARSNRTMEERSRKLGGTCHVHAVANGARNHLVA